MIGKVNQSELVPSKLGDAAENLTKVYNSEKKDNYSLT